MKNNLNKKNEGMVAVWVGVVVVLGIIAYGLMSSGSSTDEARMMAEKDRMTQEAAMQLEKDKMSNETSMKETSDKMEKTSDKMEPGDDEAMMVKPGAYVAYSPEKVSNQKSGENVVLFFRASWCPTCRALDKDIKDNLSKIPGNLTILDINYDNSTELKKKYGVTYQHTLVEVDASGNLIKKWMGSPSLATLSAEVI